MADKLRTTYPHKITFVPGEQPNAAKLSAISSQAKAGLNIIEKAIGDIWGTGGSDGGLHQTNLARTLGDAKYINPALYSLPANELFFYIEDLGTKWNGKSTGYLTFRPAYNPNAAGADVHAQIKFGKADEGSSTKYTTAISGHDYDVTIGTKMYINEQTGYFKASVSALIEAGDFIGYWVDPAEWSQGVEGFNPGVIPDPRTANPSLTISVNTDPAFAFKLTIPRREPYVTSAEASSFTGDLPHRVPSQCTGPSGNLNDNAIALTFDSGGNKRFWSTTGTDTFHRYHIPSKPANGSAFEQGDIYLWDRVGKQIVEGLEFYIDSTDEFQINIKDNAGRLGAIGISGQFCLVTHGSSLAKTVWSLSNALANHTHTANHYNDSNLDHSSFLNLYPPTDNKSVVWRASNEEADDHIQYLHREGSRDGFRDQNKGALLGDLIISQNATTFIPGTIGNTQLGDLSSIPSNKIYFGDNVAGTNPHILAGIHQPYSSTSYDNPADQVTIQLLDGSIQLGNSTSDYFTANTNNFRVTPDGGLVVFSTASSEAPTNYHGGITIESYRPRLDFLDRDDSDFRFELNSGVFDIIAQKEAGSFNDGFLQFRCGTGARPIRTEFKAPITWDASLETLANISNGHNDIKDVVDANGRPTEDVDGARILYPSSPWFDNVQYRDWLVFEKTDGNGTAPDGGIAFTTNAYDSDGDGLQRKGASLLLDGSNRAIFNGEIPERKANTAVTIVGGQYPTGLDVSNILRATQVNTQRGNVPGGNPGAIQQKLAIRDEIVLDDINGVPAVKRIFTASIEYFPANLWPTIANFVPYIGPDGDPNNSTFIFDLNKHKSSPEEVDAPGDWYLNTTTADYVLGIGPNEAVGSGPTFFWVSYLSLDSITTSTLNADTINGGAISASQVDLAELKFNDAADELTSIGQLKLAKPAEVNGGASNVNIQVTGLSGDENATGKVYELEFDLSSLVPINNNGHLHVTSISCVTGAELEYFYKMLPERCNPITNTLHVRYRWYKTDGSGNAINPNTTDTVGPSGTASFDISYMVFNNA